MTIRPWVEKLHNLGWEWCAPVKIVGCAFGKVTVGCMAFLNGVHSRADGDAASWLWKIYRPITQQYTMSQHVLHMQASYRQKHERLPCIGFMRLRKSDGSFFYNSQKARGIQVYTQDFSPIGRVMSEETLNRACMTLVIK